MLPSSYTRNSKLVDKEHNKTPPFDKSFKSQKNYIFGEDDFTYHHHSSFMHNTPPLVFPLPSEGTIRPLSRGNNHRSTAPNQNRQQKIIRDRSEPLPFTHQQQQQQQQHHRDNGVNYRYSSAHQSVYHHLIDLP